MPLYPNQSDLISAARVAAALALFALAGAAAAADRITGVKGVQIELFDAPNDVKPSAVVKPAALPWIVKEEKDSFYRVQVNGRDAWVDSMQVTVARDSAHHCSLALAKDKLPATHAAIPGAGASRCP
ncbi:MAG TPA: hypothetical protein VF861_11680 [Telluria sp.]